MNGATRSGHLTSLWLPIWLAFMGCRTRGREMSWWVEAPLEADINHCAIITSNARRCACCQVHCLMAFETACNLPPCDVEGLQWWKLKPLRTLMRALQSPAMPACLTSWRPRRVEKEGMICLPVAPLVHGVSVNLWCEWFNDTLA